VSVGQEYPDIPLEKKSKMLPVLFGVIIGVVVVIALGLIVGIFVFDYMTKPILIKHKIRSLLVMTDLETDDVIAIYLLSRRFRNTKIMFLVGEGCAYIKKLRMESYIKTLGFTNAEVVRGYGSDRLFKYDGYDIMTKEQIDGLDWASINWTAENKEEVKEKVFKFIRDESPFIISLKPPRELMEMFVNGHPRYRRIFKRCVFAGYMSFNLRCLMNDYKRKLVNFLRSFKLCYFYETHYAVGSNNIITKDDFDFDKLPEIIKNVMYLWNKFQAEDCRKTLEELEGNTDRESIKRRHRNQKTLDQIERNDHKQLVNADGGLIVSLFQYAAPYQWKSIKYDLESRNSYPIIKHGKDVKVIWPEDKEKYRKFQIDMLKNVFIQ
jgi:hypothetical protein